MLEETALALRQLQDTLEEFGPLLRLMRGMNGNGPTYVQAAGLRRTMHRGKKGAPDVT